jgi:regulator of replication initiation timing
MTHPIETRIEPRDEPRRLHDGHHPPDQERDRLQVLVGELLSENQRLRFENEGLRAKVTEAAQRTQDVERGLAEAMKWAGMLF